MGIVQQSQLPQANQEIVLKFEDHLSAEDAQQSLEEISLSLKKIGINAISIVAEDGLHRISYYSDSATKQIKKLLSERANISFEKSSTSNQKENKSFDFDVFKINQGTSTSWDFEANEVYTFNFKSDRSFNPEFFKFPILVESSKSQFDLKVAYNANKNVVFVSDNTSHNIPEVRAGPIFS